MSTKTPRHIAVIMDGNGRWARQRGWPRSRGHLEGAKAVRECVEGCLDLGVEVLTLYAFSTDNWQRPKEEIETLMGLLKRFLIEYTKEMGSMGVRFEAIGRLSQIPADCQRQIEAARKATSLNQKLTTILAVNYSGRTEIVDAVKRVAMEVREGTLEVDQIDSELFHQYLYTSRWPDPDLLIRTSGEMRVSNFLLWQLSYTEIFVMEKLWPDFKRTDLFEAAEHFAKRQRRYGGV
ncbi:MAG: isoprenyl transferase [Verrucomicrobia bacterium]|nr:isoprenyl transferase [Verrucomicrobiota bacterium]